MIAVLGCLVILAALHLLTPFWWWVMVVPFLFGFGVGRSAWRSVRTGALAAGVLWLGAAAYAHASGGAVIAGRMAAMMGFSSSWMMVGLAGLLAALAAGLAGLAGYSVKTLFGKK